MGRRATFDNAQFVAATVELLGEQGLEGTTIGAVAARLGAPTGSLYHRFASRDALIAHAWVALVEQFQEPLTPLLEAGEAVEAALHTVRWARSHPAGARVLARYSQSDLLASDLSEELNRRVTAVNTRVAKALAAFSRRVLGAARASDLRRARFAIAEVPLAAVRVYVAAGERIPNDTEELVRVCVEALVDNYRKEKNP